jgi:hypothetical protein
VRAPLRDLLRWGVALFVLAGLLLLITRLACRPGGPIGPPAPPDTADAGTIQHDAPTGEPPHGIPAIVVETVTVHTVVSRTYPDSGLADRYARLASEFRRWRIRREQDSLARLRGDSVAPDTTPRPPEVLPPVRMRYDGRTLALWLTPSSGRARLDSMRIRPRWSVAAGIGGRSDTVPVVTQDRYFVRAGRRTVRCLPRAAVMGGTGYLVLPENRLGGLVLGLGSTIAGCLLE